MFLWNADYFQSIGATTKKTVLIHRCENLRSNCVKISSPRERFLPRSERLSRRHVLLTSRIHDSSANKNYRHSQVRDSNVHLCYGERDDSSSFFWQLLPIKLTEMGNASDLYPNSNQGRDTGHPDKFSMVSRTLPPVRPNRFLPDPFQFTIILPFDAIYCLRYLHHR
jgi:hypothetical protein